MEVSPGLSPCWCGTQGRHPGGHTDKLGGKTTAPRMVKHTASLPAAGPTCEWAPCPTLGSTHSVTTALSRPPARHMMSAMARARQWVLRALEGCSCLQRKKRVCLCLWGHKPGQGSPVADGLFFPLPHREGPASQGLHAAGPPLTTAKGSVLRERPQVGLEEE